MFVFHYLFHQQPMKPSSTNDLPADLAERCAEKLCDADNSDGTWEEMQAAADYEGLKRPTYTEAKYLARAILVLREAGVAEMAAAAIDVMASLAAAISLLERGSKKAAPSDKMFDQMLIDYRNSLDRARAALSRYQNKTCG